MLKRVYAESGDTVNLREKPEAKAKILKRVPVGTVAEATAYDSDWSRFAYENVEGYMKSKFLVDVQLNQEDLKEACAELEKALALIKSLIK